jgi:hypothetical protein
MLVCLFREKAQTKRDLLPFKILIRAMFLKLYVLEIASKRAGTTAKLLLATTNTLFSNVFEF